ncbi:MAG: radical SAM protein [Elusimicrobiota bacterium]
MKKEELFSNIADQFAPEYSLAGLVDNRNNRHVEADLDARALGEQWRAALGEEAKGKRKRSDLHCYVQIPFCGYRCSFCFFYSRVAKTKSEISGYLRYLLEELAFFSPFFRGRSMQTLHIGGGTPSLLSRPQLDRFLGRLFSLYVFDKDGEKAIECTPDSIEPDQLNVLAKHGINRISMGVQSIVPEILARENRSRQKTSDIVRAIRAIRESGRFMLNIDLLIGMQGDTTESFLRTFQTVADLEPEQIIVYRLNPPAPYLRAHYGGKAESFYASVRERYHDLPRELPVLATRHSYEYATPMTLEDHAWHFMRRRRKTGRFSAYYNELTETPTSVFGVGPAARSRIAGSLYYWQQTGTDHRFDPARRIFRSQALSRRDEMIKYLLLHVQNGRTVSGREFKDLFGKGLRTAFAQVKDGARIGPDDRRGRFLAGLRLLDDARLRDLFIGDMELVTQRGALRLRIKKMAPEEVFTATAGSYGLQVLGDLRDFMPDEIAFKLVKLLAAALTRAAAAKRKAGVPGIAAALRTDMDRAFKRLHDQGRWRDISIRRNE